MMPSIVRLSLLACAFAACTAADPVITPDDPDDPADPDAVPVGLDTVALTMQNPPAMVTCMAFVPGTNDLFLGTWAGTIHHVRLVGSPATKVDNVATFEVPQVHAQDDCGLISLAFAPDFATTRELFVGHCTSTTESAIRRVPLDAKLAPIPGADRDVFRAGDPAAVRAWHNVGSIGFEPDGTLWAFFGDKVIRPNGQTLDDALGALVRMVPTANGAVPAADNPFVGSADKSEYIYAWGLRSPWRGTLDAKGRWFVGDVGEATWEEVDMVMAAEDNFGWGDVEGPCELGAACEGLTDPLIAWHRGEDDPRLLDDPDAEPVAQRVAWVGPSYDAHRGDGPDRYAGLLDDRILYGDLCLGFLRGVVVDDDGVVTDDRHLAHLAGSTAMAVGPDGFMYAATFGKCMNVGPEHTMKLLRLVPRYEDE